MKSSDLKTALAPFNKIMSRKATSTIYKSIELGNGVVRACAAYGILEANLSIAPIMETLSQSVFVDAATFLTVINSSLPNEEFIIDIDETSLIWSCQRARGRLALINSVEEMPSIDFSGIQFSTFPEDLVRGLELGSISCDNAAISAIGMYGIVIYNPGIFICSTDNVTLSSATVVGELLGAPAVSTLPPEGVELLIDIMDAEAQRPVKSGGVIGFDAKAWYYADERRICKISMFPPLKSDVINVLFQYKDDTVFAPIPADSINKFVKRATALAEVRKNATVGVAASNGRLTLSFKEGASTADEDFLIAEFDGLPDMPEITLSATKVARALTHAKEIIMDHMERGIVLFRGYQPDFDYVISGSVVTK